MKLSIYMKVRESYFVPRLGPYGKIVKFVIYNHLRVLCGKDPYTPIFHILLYKNLILISFIFHEMHELNLDSSMENQIKYVCEMFGNSYFE